MHVLCSVLLCCLALSKQHPKKILKIREDNNYSNCLSAKVLLPPDEKALKANEVKSCYKRPSLVSVFQWMEAITKLMCSGAHAVNPAVGETHPGSYLVPTQCLLTVEALVLEILSKGASVIHFPAQVSLRK